MAMQLAKEQSQWETPTVLLLPQAVVKACVYGPARVPCHHHRGRGHQPTLYCLRMGVLDTAGEE